MLNENLPIDPSQLDEEWLQQPLLFDEAQQEAADCLKARDQAKDELEQFEAERSNFYRSDAEKQSKKITEKALLEMLLLDPDVKIKRSELNEANYQLNLANNTVRTFDMRKSALAKLTDLWISNYFSTPNPNHLVEEGKRYIKATDIDAKSAEATEKLNERKKARTTKDGKTKEEVLASIKNPETREAAKVAIEKEEAQETEPKPRVRRSRRS